MTEPVDEIQLVTIVGNPTGSRTWTLTFQGATTVAVRADVGQLALQVALAALPTIGAGNVDVTKSGNQYTVMFQGDLAGQDLPLLVADYSDFNKGSVVVTTLTEGSEGLATPGAPPAPATDLPPGGPLLLPPKIEDLVITYLRGWMAPVPVVTRLPQPDNDADTVNGLIRIEAAGGVQANKTQFDMSFLVHAYSPDEDQANDIYVQAISLIGVARGSTIDGYYIVTVENADMPKKQTDPDVILPRYLGTATWRVAGQPWTPTPA